MSTKTMTIASLDGQSKTQEQLHAAWLQRLEEAALVGQEHKEAKKKLRAALDAFEKAAMNETLDGARQRINKRLLRAIQVERVVASELKDAKKAESDAREALGLPRSQRGDEDDEEAN